MCRQHAYTCMCEQRQTSQQLMTTVPRWLEPDDAHKIGMKVMINGPVMLDAGSGKASSLPSCSLHSIGASDR